MVVGQIWQDCARTECIVLLGGERAWDVGNGDGAVAEINPDAVCISVRRGEHIKEKGPDILGG